MIRFFAVLLMAGLIGLPGKTEELLSDPEAEARAKALMHELACLVCEGQPVSQSDASVAVRMRAEVRELVAAGADDDAVRAWMKAEYGEGVLLRPPLSGPALLLWITPALLLVTGGFLAMRLLGPQREITVEHDGSVHNDVTPNQQRED